MHILKGLTQKYTYLALILFLWAGLSYSYGQIDTLKAKSECIKIIKNSGQLGKIKNKISDSEIVFLIFQSDGKKTFCSFYLKREPNITFDWKIDNIKKEVESGMIEDLR